MERETFRAIEAHMQEMMKDSAHDQQHVYRVLRQAMALAKHYPQTDEDVLIAACLLHDIGRQAQLEDPSICHARVGADLAYEFMLGLGWSRERCAHIRACIASHRFRSDDPPKSIEARILFDADKLDVTGAMGIARSLMYQGAIGTPLYTLDSEGKVQDHCAPGSPDSFLREYHFKLLPLYDRFFTPEAAEVGQKRKEFLQHFHRELLEEIDPTAH